MKLKLKLDKQQVLEFLTAHVEKGAFGIFILAFLLFCIGALKHSPYDKVPKDFMDTSSRVDSKVTASTFDPTTDIPPVDPLPEAHDVEDVAWRTHVSWSRPAFDSKKRRPEPKFLAVQDVRVATGYGAISVRSVEGDAAGANPAAAPQPQRQAAGGGLRAAALAAQGAAAPDANPVGRPGTSTSVKGKQWAVITGLVPIAAQTKEYRTAFRDARHSDAYLDSPHYQSFDIERAEVPPGTSADAELKWVLLDRKLADKEEAAFGELALDPVDPAFADSVLTKQLPKISGKEHDRSVSHPKLPTSAPAQGGGAPAPQAAPPPAAGGGGLLAAVRGGGRPAAGGGNVGNTTQDPRIDYKLFRCLDFSVLPGRTYRYRVRLVLHNPNYNVGAQYLANAALAKGATRPSPWSDPSSEINVPRGFSMLAGNAKAARGLNDQKIDVILRMWDQREAVDAARIAELVRGQVANFPAEDVPIDRIGGAPEMRKIPFRTDMMVVDITGGDQLSVSGGPRARAPSQVLVLEPNGKLTVKSELADAETYDPTRQRLKEMQDAVKPPPAADKDDDEKDKSKKKKGEPTPGLGGLRGAVEAAKGKGK